MTKIVHDCCHVYKSFGLIVSEEKIVSENQKQELQMVAIFMQDQNEKWKFVKDAADIVPAKSVIIPKG